MVIPIPQVLDAQQLGSIRSILAESRFVDGRLSAGLSARKVKNNEEVPQDSTAIQKLNQLVMNQLYNHPVFQAAVMPLKLATPFYARYLAVNIMAIMWTILSWAHRAPTTAPMYPLQFF